MTGPEHYRRAEALEQLAVKQYEENARDVLDGYDPSLLWQLTMQQAQVHATLALAAATWDGGSSAAADEPLHRDEWARVTA